MTAGTVPHINGGRRRDHTASRDPGAPPLGNPYFPNHQHPHRYRGSFASSPGPASTCPRLSQILPEVRGPRGTGLGDRALSLPRIIPLPGTPGLSARTFPKDNSKINYLRLTRGSLINSPLLVSLGILEADLYIQYLSQNETINTG